PAARDAPANARDDGAHRWEFHDRLFHMRSRIGFHTAAVGPTFRFADREGPLPLYKPVASERHIALTAPSADTLPTVSLADALETRQSRRTYASDPVTRDELSTFLFLSCRVKSEVRVADAQPADGPQTAYDWSRRPSPSGGGCHSLEVYLLIERCQGVDPGVYHYDPEAHRLHVLDAPEGVRRSMLLQAQYLNGEQAMPDVLIVLASRFGRMNWKYESMAYATVLKDAGALLQTLYLACEATGLAGTAVGAGSIVDFQRLIGVPVTEESSVAEFLLGRPMADAE
ncbi:MAG: SagB family peptide dehydrogenase, partial [Acidobacteriota bacterium]